MGGGGGTPPVVNVDLHHNPARDELVLRVADNGVGLPADADPHTAQSLGLQLVRMLTEQSVGRVEVDRGAGTAFTVTFPAGGHIWSPAG